MKSFHDLQVWPKSHDLTLAIYHATAGFPKAELFGLTSQLRRAGASIPSNLAEGCGRAGDGDFARFCSIAMGSASELEYQLLLARDLKLIDSKKYGALVERAIEVKRMLAALIKNLKADR